MSKIEQLIKELCPNGVEYNNLGELGVFLGGITGKSKEDFTNGNSKFITYKNIYSNPSLKIDVEDKVRIFEGEKQNTLEYGDVLFTGSSETPEECGISSVLTIKTDEELFLNSFCFIFRFNNKSLMIPNFSKHLFRSPELRYKIIKTANGVTRFNISKKLMNKIKIPIPPLQVQREIVRILDTFSEYTTELTTELTMRKKQYEYYRDSLLNINNKLFNKKIAISKLCLKVNNVMWGDNTDTEYDYIDLSSVNIDSSSIIGTKKITKENAPSRAKQIVKTDDVLFGTTRPTLKRYYIVNKEYNNQICSTGFCVLRPNKNLIISKYLFFIISSYNFYDYVDKNQEGASYPAISNIKVKDYKIPVPPLEEQQRIVDILDRFDTLCNDISKGLPAEIEVRKKQYEYYRDKLLSFKEIS